MAGEGVLLDRCHRALRFNPAIFGDLDILAFIGTVLPAKAVIICQL